MNPTLKQMTPEKFAALTPEQLRDLPWDYPGMVAVPGRYYYGHFFIHIPPINVMPKGADITGILWRYDDKPEEWVVTQRLRIYVDDDNTHKSSDMKLWMSDKIEGNEQQAVEKLLQTPLFQIPEGVEPASWIIVKGDHDAMGAALKAASEDGKHTYLHVEKQIVRPADPAGN